MSDKPVWQIDVERLAQEILSKTRTAQTEEDVKMRVEPLVRRAFQQIGVDVDIVAYEKTTALTAKRMDAVYGYVIIEYKSPSKLASRTAVEKAEKQLHPQFLLRWSRFRRAVGGEEPRHPVFRRLASAAPGTGGVVAPGARSR